MPNKLHSEVTQILLRGALKSELERSLHTGIRHGRFTFATAQEVMLELERRETLERKRADRLQYPELSHS